MGFGSLSFYARIISGQGQSLDAKAAAGRDSLVRGAMLSKVGYL